VTEGYDAGVRLTESIERDMVQVRVTDPFCFVVPERRPQIGPAPVVRRSGEGACRAFHVRADPAASGNNGRAVPFGFHLTRQGGSLRNQMSLEAQPYRGIQPVLRPRALNLRTPQKRCLPSAPSFSGEALSQLHDSPSPLREEGSHCQP